MAPSPASSPSVCVRFTCSIRSSRCWSAGPGTGQAESGIGQAAEADLVVRPLPALHVQVRADLVAVTFFFKLYVLRVLDHEEYDRVPWATQCGCHSPPPKRRTPPTKQPAHTGRPRR